MAVARAAFLEPQAIFQVPVEKSALVIGGGAAGMTAALNLADQGFPVALVEKESTLGGNLRHVHISSNHRDPQKTLRTLVSRVDNHPAIATYLESQVIETSGFKGNFKTKLQLPKGKTLDLSHGAIIIATGGQEYRGEDYGFGRNPRVISQSELETQLTDHFHPLFSCQSVAMVLCIGPAERYCSRICCTVALKNALAIKQSSPSTEVTIFYKDIRVYGTGEDLYTRAREAGILFVRYSDERHPEIVKENPLIVRAFDLALQQEIELTPDVLVLSMPVVPRDDAVELASLVKAPLDSDGFFLEAHVKLRPVDTTKDGVFIAGMAHYPKLLEESVIQAQAAAARAARVLSRDYLMAGGQVAFVEASHCTGCLTCVRICPFDVPVMRADLAGVGGIMGAAHIEAAICQGCGNCVAECPAQAIQLMHYTDRQIEAKLEALVRPHPILISINDQRDVKGA
jgi:heterodisulfide reductase subunit A-like polyferredoxin